MADGAWGDRKSYNLIVNTTNWNIDELAKAVAEYVKIWFASKNAE